MLRTLMRELDHEKQRTYELARRADHLYVENLRLQLEMDRYRKWYYGPRADRLQSSGDLASAAEDLLTSPRRWVSSWGPRRQILGCGVEAG